MEYGYTDKIGTTKWNGRLLDVRHYTFIQTILSRMVLYCYSVYPRPSRGDCGLSHNLERSVVAFFWDESPTSK